MSQGNLASERVDSFIPASFQLANWEDALPYYQDLCDRPIQNVRDLQHWILDKSELDSYLSEAFSWRYIRLSVDSNDQQALEAYHHAVQHISPNIAAFEQRLNEKLVQSPFLSQLDQHHFFIYLRLVRNAVELFHPENVPLNTEVQLKSKEYGRIFSQMTIGVDGKQMTLQKASTLLEETDRERRQQVYEKINERILQDTEALEQLFDDLLKRRHQIALNAGFPNFRDYAFQLLGRFDYTPEDCLHLHESIAGEILPILDELNVSRQQRLALEQLRPWDLNIDTSGKDPLRPFENEADLLEKGIQCLNQLHPAFGDVIALMRQKGHLDLESRPGKRPGGYNMPLQVTRLPFIFMNATHSLNDLRTCMHECGHAIHFYLTREEDLVVSRRFPSEVSELAAMSMELLTMDHWDVFFPNADDLRRARIGQLENVLKVLPWIATIDKFQHWLYTTPNHSREQRKEQWLAIFKEFSSTVVDYSGLDRYLEFLWHKQLHIFEAPFYYIEYAIAQLGAIAIWQRYRQAPDQAIADYIAALHLGHTRPISEIYQKAGIAFRFDQEYVSHLGQFVREEIHKLM